MMYNQGVRGGLRAALTYGEGSFRITDLKAEALEDWWPVCGTLFSFLLTGSRQDSSVLLGTEAQRGGAPASYSFIL